MERQRVLSAERAAGEAEHELVARLRWEQERRRSVAHARMRDTTYTGESMIWARVPARYG